MEEEEAQLRIFLLATKRGTVEKRAPPQGKILQGVGVESKSAEADLTETMAVAVENTDTKRDVGTESVTATVKVEGTTIEVEPEVNMTATETVEEPESEYETVEEPETKSEYETVEEPETKSEYETVEEPETKRIKRETEETATVEIDSAHISEVPTQTIVTEEAAGTSTVMADEMEIDKKADDAPEESTQAETKRVAEVDSSVQQNGSVLNVLNLMAYDQSEDEQEDNNGSDPRSPATELPPSPTGKCHPALQRKVLQFTQRMQSLGEDYTQRLRSHHEYSNPAILEKLVGSQEIVSSGSNYPIELWNPQVTDPMCFHDALDREQYNFNSARAKREAAKAGAKKTNVAPKKRTGPMR